MALWILGDAYVLKVGAVDWDDATSIAEEKYEGASFGTVPVRPVTPTTSGAEGTL
jgi:NADH-quinone oxidoreductase subunit A